MNERYSEEVKSILEAAQQQAVINYNQELTCAHLLVALAGSEGFFPFLLCLKMPALMSAPLPLRPNALCRKYLP